MLPIVPVFRVSRVLKLRSGIVLEACGVLADPPDQEDNRMTSGCTPHHIHGLPALARAPIPRAPKHMHCELQFVAEIRPQRWYKSIHASRAC